MKFFSRNFFKVISEAIAEQLHKAVPAVSQSPMVPRWRNLGKPVTPYHFLRPIPVQVQQKRKA